MKICVLKSVCPPFDPRIFQREVKALVQAGHQVTQICPYDKKEDRVSGVRLLGFAGRTKLLLRPINWFHILTLIRREPSDVYHFSDPELLPMALFLTWFAGKTVVFDCFEHYSKAIMSDVRIPTFARPLSARIYGLLERKIAEQLAAVVVPAIEEDGEKRFRHVRRLVLVRNLPWRSVFESVPADVKRKRQLVYIGDISESRRRMSALVDMLGFMHNKDVSLLLIGKVDTPETRAVLEAHIAAGGLQGRVTIVGEVPYEAIQAYLVESAVGLVALRVIPRWETDIPQKMFEYMACRLPFVAANLPPPRKYAAETGAGLCVTPESAEDFARAVDYLLDHPDEAQRMGENGRRAFMEKYNLEAESQHLIDLYAALECESAEKQIRT